MTKFWNFARQSLLRSALFLLGVFPVLLHRVACVVVGGANGLEWICGWMRTGRQALAERCGRYEPERCDGEPEDAAGWVWKPGFADRWTMKLYGVLDDEQYAWEQVKAAEDELDALCADNSGPMDRATLRQMILGRALAHEADAHTRVEKCRVALEKAEGVGNTRVIRMDEDERDEAANG